MARPPRRKRSQDRYSRKAESQESRPRLPQRPASPKCPADGELRRQGRSGTCGIGRRFQRPWGIFGFAGLVPPELRGLRRNQRGLRRSTSSLGIPPTVTNARFPVTGSRSRLRAGPVGKIHRAPAHDLALMGRGALATSSTQYQIAFTPRALSITSTCSVHLAEPPA